MKKYTVILLVIAMSFSFKGSAQSSVDIPLRVVLLPEQSGIPKDAAEYMDNKLMSIVADNGVGVTSGASQFFITAKTNKESLDIVGSAPAMTAINLTIYLYMADIFDGKLLYSTSFNAKGVGQSEAKAYIDAIKRININTAAVKQFITKGRSKIIDYYNSQGATIIAQAKSAAKMQDYQRAIFMLVSIPTFCEPLYEEAQGEILRVFDEYVNYMGKKYLAEAKVIWAAGQNRESAQRAGELLAMIEPNASCIGEAETLLKEIKGRIGEEWQLQLRMYDDSVGLEKQRIEAARQVGIAYGNHQQPQTTNITWLR